MHDLAHELGRGGAAGRARRVRRQLRDTRALEVEGVPRSGDRDAVAALADGVERRGAVTGPLLRRHALRGAREPVVDGLLVGHATNTAPNGADNGTDCPAVVLSPNGAPWSKTSNARVPRGRGPA